MPADQLSVCQLGDRKERKRGTPLFSPSHPPLPSLSVSSCRVSFSSVLALPRRGSLQRASATCWLGHLNTTDWNLDLTTPPLSPSLPPSLCAPFYPSSVLHRSISPSLSLSFQNVFLQLNCPTYFSLPLSFFLFPSLSQSECILLSPGCL